MKALVSALVLVFFAGVAGAQPNPQSEKAALAAAQAILNINFPGDPVYLKVIKSKTDGDDAHDSETFTIKGHALDQKGRQISADFFLPSCCVSS